ncbi:MAG: hypothetical protein Q8K67_00595 [Geothrix sp.]|nr:hypothetical protein [Geothrix sp.]
MNVERLHAIASALRADIEKTDLMANMQKLISGLQNQVSQPGQPQFQQQVGQALVDLQTSLTKSEVHLFSPAWRQVMEELGASTILGTSLEEQVKEIFARNQITPSVALQDLQRIHSELQSLVTSLDQLLSSFRQLHIGEDELEKGESEVGVLIPRGFVKNQLGEFSDELKELNQIFGVFSELTIGSRPGFQIKTISSSDLTVYIMTPPAVAASIAVAVGWIIATYKNLLEIRKLQGDLAKQGLDKKELKGIEDHSNKVMSKGIDLLVLELLAEAHKGLDSGRKNELSVELKYSLTKLANRVDRGFNIEVRMSAPESPESENEQEPAELSEKAVEHFDKIKAASKNLQFLKLVGEPILSLSEEKTAKNKKAE